MFNLMKIEFKKNKMKSDIFGVVLANIAIFIASTITAILVGFKDVSQENVIYYHIEQIVQVTVVIFSVYGAILVGNLVGDEFNDGTVKTLFLYPQARERILLAKVCTVIAFVVLSIIFTLGLQLILFLVSNKVFSFYVGLGYNYIVSRPIIYFMGIISAIGFVLLATFISYKSKSTLLTVLVILLVSGKSYADRLGTRSTLNTIFPIIVFIIGILSYIYVAKNLNEIGI